MNSKYLTTKHSALPLDQKCMCKCENSARTTNKRFTVSITHFTVHFSYLQLKKQTEAKQHLCSWSFLKLVLVCKLLWFSLCGIIV